VRQVTIVKCQHRFIRDLANRFLQTQPEIQLENHFWQCRNAAGEILLEKLIIT
jgi:hypothetical protein